MFRRMLPFGTEIALIFLAMSPMTVGAQQHPQHHEHHAKMQAGNPEEEVEIGNKGEVSFDVETKVGGLILQPGTYRFQHRVENGDHFVRFTEIGPIQEGSRRRGVAGEATCALGSVREKFSRTAIFSVDEGGANRVTRIEVKGENVIHLF